MPLVVRNVLSFVFGCVPSLPSLEDAACFCFLSILLSVSLPCCFVPTGFFDSGSDLETTTLGDDCFS